MTAKKYHAKIAGDTIRITRLFGKLEATPFGTRTHDRHEQVHTFPNHELFDTLAEAEVHLVSEAKRLVEKTRLTHERANERLAAVENGDGIQYRSIG